MRSFSDQIAVGVAVPVRVFSFMPQSFHSVVIRNAAAHADFLYVGAGGVSLTDGFPLRGGETVSFTWQDFDYLRLGRDQVVDIYGISDGAVGTTAYVFGFQGDR